MIPWWRTDFTEANAQAVAEAVRSRCLSQGKITRGLEERLAERLGVPYVCCTTSGTTALTMALLAAGVGRGDEVIVPDRTWIATAHAVMLTGAKVILSDVDERGVLSDCDSDCMALPVNFNGRLAHCGPLDIEDSCQSFPEPPRGLAACYSMSTAKILPTGQGGFIATRDEGFYKECRALRTHDVEDAMVPQVLEWKRFGYNFRFTDIQAALALSQLETLDDRIAAIKVIHAEYLRLGVPVLPSPLPLYNELVVPFHVEPERLRAHFAAYGIEARPFYPPLHTAPYLHAAGSSFPNADKFSRGLFLPSGPHQNIADIQSVALAYHDYQS